MAQQIQQSSAYKAQLLFAMFTTRVLAILPWAVAALSSPVARQYSDWCPFTLGGGLFDHAKDFTLSAWNTTLPNANATGVPLVVSLGSAGVHVLSVSTLI